MFSDDKADRLHHPLLQMLHTPSSSSNLEPYTLEILIDVSS